MTTKPKLEKTYSVKQVARKLGISVATVRRRIEEGLLGAINVGKGDKPRWRVPKSVLAAYQRLYVPGAAASSTQELPAVAGGEPYISFAEAQVQTGIHISTLYEWRKRGDLFVQPGPPASVRVSDIQAAVAKLGYVKRKRKGAAAVDQPVRPVAAAEPALVSMVSVDVWRQEVASRSTELSYKEWAAQKREAEKEARTEQLATWLRTAVGGPDTAEQQERYRILAHALLRLLNGPSGLHRLLCELLVGGGLPPGDGPTVSRGLLECTRAGILHEPNEPLAKYTDAAEQAAYDHGWQLNWLLRSLG